MIYKPAENLFEFASQCLAKKLKMDYKDGKPLPYLSTFETAGDYKNIPEEAFDSYKNAKDIIHENDSILIPFLFKRHILLGDIRDPDRLHINYMYMENPSDIIVENDMIALKKYNRDVYFIVVNNTGKPFKIKYTDPHFDPNKLDKMPISFAINKYWEKHIPK